MNLVSSLFESKRNHATMSFADQCGLTGKEKADGYICINSVAIVLCSNISYKIFTPRPFVLTALVYESTIQVAQLLK